MFEPLYFILIYLFFDLISYTRNYRGRDGIVEETPVHVYYAYLKPT